MTDQIGQCSVMLADDLYFPYRKRGQCAQDGFLDPTTGRYFCNKWSRHSAHDYVEAVKPCERCGKFGALKGPFFEGPTRFDRYAADPNICVACERAVEHMVRCDGCGHYFDALRHWERITFDVCPACRPLQEAWAEIGSIFGVTRTHMHRIARFKPWAFRSAVLHLGVLANECRKQSAANRKDHERPAGSADRRDRARA